MIAIARTAAAHGAKVITYAEVDRLTDSGAQVTDVLTGHPFTVRRGG